MRVVRYIILSPIGIAFVLVHWLVVTYSLLGDFPSAENIYHNYTMLGVYLMGLNMPALLITHLLGTPLISFFGIEAWANYIYTIFAILFCSFQWLVVGALLQFLISQYTSDSREQSIGLRSS